MNKLDDAIQTMSGQDKSPVTVISNVYNVMDGRPLKIAGEYCTLLINNDITITAKENQVPIQATSSVCELVIKGEGTLTLIGSYQQPCIGSLTHTGMSYGRWSPSAQSCLKRLVIDGATVMCQSRVKNFSIGCYNNNELPEIEEKNGGELIAPEMEGSRIQTITAYPPAGSTKVSMVPEYVIIEPGMSEEDYIPNDIKEIIKDLPDSIKNHITLETNKVAIQKTEQLIRYNKKFITDDKIIQMLEMKSQDHIQYAYGSILLSIPEIDHPNEMFYEMSKCEYMKRFINCALTNDDPLETYFASMIRYLRNALEPSQYRNELLYEMIPAYLYNWGHEEDKYNHIHRFITQNYNPKFDNYIDFDKLVMQYR